MRGRVLPCAVVMACWTGLAAPAAAAIIHEETNAPPFFDGELRPEVVAAGFDQIHGSIGGR